VAAFDTSAGKQVQSEGAPGRRLGQRFEEVGGFYSEGVCQRNDVYDRDIPFAPLDAAYVVAMQIR